MDPVNGDHVSYRSIYYLVLRNESMRISIVTRTLWERGGSAAPFITNGRIGKGWLE